jgi:hypothetical protein
MKRLVGLRVPPSEPDQGTPPGERHHASSSPCACPTRRLRRLRPVERPIAAARPCPCPCGSRARARDAGRVHFPVQCSPEAQAAFDEGMKLQHSFWYQAAGAAFQQVRQRDPGCTMAHWGEALILLTNPVQPAHARQSAPGPCPARRGESAGCRATSARRLLEALSIGLRRRRLGAAPRPPAAPIAMPWGGCTRAFRTTPRGRSITR